MRLHKTLARFAACGARFLFASALASADTIVLKNGRRIRALSVTEEGDKIHYETSAGTLTLPKSIVDHIEKGGFMPGTQAAAAADLAITPPALESIGIASEGNQIEMGAVHDGSIDRTFIAKLEGDARTGGRAAGEAPRLRTMWPRNTNWRMAIWITRSPTNERRSILRPSSLCC